MARMAQPPPKFMPPEWVLSNQMKYANAEGERAAAERLSDEAIRVIDETDKTTIRVQKDVNKKLDQRINEIKFWDQELGDKLDGFKQETDALLTYEARLEKAIESVREPLKAAKQCLAYRQGRKGIDLVHDEAEKQLIKEVEVYEGVLALLSRSKSQAAEQMRLNRKAAYRLDKDLMDKSTAIAIDSYNLELRNAQDGLQATRNGSKISNNYSNPNEWESFSNQNILEAEKQRQNTAALRGILDGILDSTYNDMLKQKNITDVALLDRIKETRDAKEKLEDHVAKVKAQIIEMDDNAERLRNAIEAKEHPMQLAHTRLENRTQRPNVELCRDNVQYRLVTEVTLLGQSVEKLAATLANVNESIKGLTRRQLEIEEDIDIKANTLYIDATLCMGLRKSVNIQQY